MKKLLFILLISVIINDTPRAFSAEKLFDVVTKEPSSDQRSIAFVDTVTGKDRIVEVNMSGKVVWEWQFPTKLIRKRKRSICKGADIKYLKSKDELLFIIPSVGAYIVNRKGNLKKVIEDKKISHDIDLLPNGNFIYVRGWADKGEDEVREINQSGKIVWKWSHAEHFPNREKFLLNIPKKTKMRWKGEIGRRKTLKSGGIDWAHVNGVERLENGDTLISLRNFMMFVIVGPDGKPKRSFQDIWLVHEPHKTAFGYIAADRFVKRGRFLHSIVKVSNGGERTNLLTGQFLTVRGIEELPNQRFNITSIGNVFEIDSNGKILHRMHLNIQTEDAERNVTKRRRPGMVMSEGRCAHKNLYKVAKTKVYK